MYNLFKIAIRNLKRYKRRTFLTASLITIGIVFVLVFISVSGSFKSMIIGQITDSMLGHIQIHKKGYVESIDNLPLTMMLQPKTVASIRETLDKMPNIESYSMRIKFGGLLSNFVETTGIRLNGVYPEQESATVPLLMSRIIQGEKSIKQGEVLLPELIAKGMNVKVDDTVVIIATNKDGSVNGQQFVVGGILESVTGPGGRDGYMHIEDAMDVLRMDTSEISEIAIRLKDFAKIDDVFNQLDTMLLGSVNTKQKSGEVSMADKKVENEDKPRLEIHTWEKLSPFYNIARMIDVMTFFIKLMLIAIVLVSIMNVMIMAVYERIGEIGTIAAIGTMPGKILSMFVIEGFCLGLLGAVIGTIVGGLIIFILNLAKITFNFGRQSGLILSPTMNIMDIVTISGIVIAISILASLQPAYKASKMNPIDALRHV